MLWFLGGGVCKCCAASGRGTPVLRVEGCVETAIAGPDSGSSCARLPMGGGIIVYGYVAILFPMRQYFLIFVRVIRLNEELKIKAI